MSTEQTAPTSEDEGVEALERSYDRIAGSLCADPHCIASVDDLDALLVEIDRHVDDDRELFRRLV